MDGAGSPSPAGHYAPVVELTRGGIVESLHLGAVAVSDARGRLVASYGSPQAVSFLRSSAKPFQALPLVESGAAGKLGLTAREIALTCASHRGMDMHVETAARIQALAGVEEGDLLCGTHPPGDAATARRLVQAGLDPTPNRHNCSGKHSGMLAFARYSGARIQDYINPAHPIQQAILAAFSEMCSLEPSQVVVGIDGCSAPNFAAPLANVAAAFARLADPGDQPPARASALRTIFEAMNAEPEMVRGPGGFDTELMRLHPGRLVSKGGAEGYQGIGLAAGALGPGSPALGIALKVADGQSRAVHTATLEVLRQLGALSEADLAALRAFEFSRRLPLRNFRGLETGEQRACFRLRRD